MARLFPNRIDDKLKKEMIAVLTILKNDNESNNISILYSTKENNDFDIKKDEIIILAPNKGIFILKVYDNDVFKEDHSFEAKDTCYYKIKDFLNKQNMNDFLLGWGMAFSACKMGKKDSNSYAKEQIFNLDDNFSLFVSNLSDYYYDKRDRKHKPNCDEINKIFNLIKPTLGLYESAKKEGEVISLTNEQEILLCDILKQKKVVIHGAAGTGKTEVALILARKCCEKGLKTAYFTNNLAARDKVRKIISEMPFDKSNFVCDAFQEYLISFCKKSGVLPEDEDPYSYDKEKKSEFYEYKLKKLVLEALENNNPNFTVIIMDQAQDNVDPEYLFIISLFLKKRMLNGTWYFFGDFLHQLLFRRSVFSDRLKQYLDAFINADIVDRELSINYRSDKKICDELNRITKTNVICGSNEDGVVEYINYNGDNEIKELDKILNELIVEKKYPLNKITILGVKDYDKSLIKDSTFFEMISDDVNINDKIYFSTIFKFKGLENDVIIIFDLNSSKKDENEEKNKNYRIQLLYTGISRARHEVYIFQNDYDSMLLEKIYNESK